MKQKRVSLTHIKDVLPNIHNDVCSLIYAYANVAIALLKVSIIPYNSQVQEILVIPIYDYVTVFKFDHPFLLPLFMPLNDILYNVQTVEELKLRGSFTYISFNNAQYFKIKHILEKQRFDICTANNTLTQPSENESEDESEEDDEEDDEEEEDN